MKAKKKFGQHFLYNSNTAFQIVEALGDLSEKSVLEIGPGKGILSQFLYKECGEYKAVEIDQEAVEVMYRNYPEAEIIHADILKLELQDLFKGPFHLIGNFPYNISSQIVFKILENRDWIESWVGMFQLEMGQRLLSGANSKEYGILSVLLPFYYKMEKVMVLAPGAFQPAPKVRSIVLRAVGVNHQWKCRPKTLHRVVKTSFNQRRKVLSNSLSSILSKEILNQSQFANLRPENLNSQDFEALCQFVEEHVGS